MKSQIEYGLEGAFKMDLYKGGEFVSSTDYFSNFITPTGLTYPNRYSFADCFKFLSLGSLSAQHSGTTGLGGFGTTGLSLPIGNFSTSNGSQGANYVGWEGYATGATSSNCGTVLSEAGVRFFRAWYIPTGDISTTVNEVAGGLSIGEFMVSPGSGADPIGKSAFSRVIRNLFIPNGYRAIISYQLKVNIRNTGISSFGAGTFQTGNAEVSNDAALIATWANLSGYYRQVYNGLRYVDNLGFTYVTRLGDGMEPSSNNLNSMLWYLSPDNSQFDVNSLNGGAQTDFSKAYKSDGLMAYIKNLDLSSVVSKPGYLSMTHDDFNNAYYYDAPTVVDDVPAANEFLTNIRLGKSDNALLLPQTNDYRVDDAAPGNFTYLTKQTNLDAKSISYATPGVNGFSDAFSDFGKRAVFTSASIKLPFYTGNQNAITGRKKTITRKAAFSPVSSLGYNTRFGSLVYAFNQASPTPDTALYYPMIDCMFYDSSGRALMPHYRFISGIQLSERGTGIVDAGLYLSGSFGQNIFKFVPLKTFQGQFVSNMSGHPICQQIAYQDDPITPTVTYYSGFLASGALNVNAYGTTGTFNVGNINSPNGWGSVYGVAATSEFYTLPFDIGLADHSPSGNLFDPSNTGAVYWPIISPVNRIFLNYSGLTFYHPDIGLVSDTGWYGPNQQIVRSINFNLLDSGYSDISNSAPTFVKNVTGNVGNSFSGYFLTTKQYFNSAVNVPTDTVQFNNYGFTGYVTSSAITPGKLFGTTWKDQGLIPLNSFSFIPQTTPMTLFGTTGVKRVTGFFTGLTDRGYPNGTGNPFQASDLASVFFTGFSGSSPLYLTYISGSGNSAWGLSYLSGLTALTDFCPPRGNPIHFETSGSIGARLAPNFSKPNYYGSDLYEASYGGELPALSLDNGLEMYLDISWSSPCGPSVAANTCLEPI